MSVIRVVSYNIHKGKSALGSRESLNDLRLGLHGLRADLAFLQEVQGRNARKGTLDAQHEMLGAALHMETAYGCNAVHEHTDHGNALLSRFPILSSHNEDISDHKMEQRGLLHTVVKIREHEVHCFVAHLGLFKGSRMRQIEAMVARIGSEVPSDAPVIVAGDFNDWNNILSPLLMHRLNLHEVFASAPRSHGGFSTLRDSVGVLSRAFRNKDLTMLNQLRTGVQYGAPQLGMGNTVASPRPPRTFPALFPWLRLDRIYQRGFSVRQARVLQGRPWTRLSDHAPLIAELELP